MENHKSTQPYYLSDISCIKFEWDIIDFDFLQVLSCCFKGDLMFDVFMSTNLLCVNPFLFESWFVWGLGEWFALVECGGSTGGGDNFYCNCWSLIYNFTEHLSFLQVFLIHFPEADYLPGFYVDWYPCKKGLIVTWRQILNRDMTRENIHMHVYIYVCA